MLKILGQPVSNDYRAQLQSALQTRRQEYVLNTLGRHVPWIGKNPADKNDALQAPIGRTLVEALEAAAELHPRVPFSIETLERHRKFFGGKAPALERDLVWRAHARRLMQCAPADALRVVGETALL